MLDGNQHQQIRTHGDPDLRLDGVDRIAEEVLDRQILLQPPEEQIDLPAVLVDRGNRQRRRLEQIGQKHQMLAGIRIAISNRRNRKSTGKARQARLCSC